VARDSQNADNHRGRAGKFTNPKDYAASPVHCLVMRRWERAIQDMTEKKQLLGIGGDELRQSCPECGSRLLSWSAVPRKRSGVPEGRLRTHEVGCDFILGCDECSETVRVVDACEIASLLSDAITSV